MTKRDATIVEVLKLLKASGDSPVSGQAISDTLSISRTAVWKQIAKLKELGFSISSSRARGYTLENLDAPFNAVELLSDLKTEFVGRDVYYYDEVTSTNITAVELAQKGAREGTVVIADAQKGGKGRLGRSWVSPGSDNLYTSIILRPNLAPAKAPSLTLVAAVAVAEAIQATVSQKPTVKWPNDILIEKMKVSGILMEMSADMDRVNHVVCGIGVNINSAPKLEQVRGLKATSLRAASGVEIDRAAFAQVLYSSVEKWYKVILKEGFEPAIEAWRGYFVAEGKSVTIDAIDRSVSGICMGIDNTGALLVREGSGKLSTITSGDMTLS
jgi:BirA family biotin operon repressor/biotin-[acetyl-CoA-carboxylase] ligase